MFLTSCGRRGILYPYGADDPDNTSHMYQYIRGIPEKEYREEPVDETAKEKEKTPLGFDETLQESANAIEALAKDLEKLIKS